MEFLIVLAFVAALLALVAGALALVGVRGVKEPAGKVPELEETVAHLKERVAALEKQVTPQEPRKDPTPKKKGNPWDDFLADYNLLAASLEGAQSQEACDRFFALQQLKGLICLDPAAQESGKPAPKFVEVAQAAKSAYWALAIGEGDKQFAIVPNPVKGYTKNLHEKGGMKETFASNFEEKDAPRVQVKLPALFSHEAGAWKITQPGIVKLLEEHE